MDNLYQKITEDKKVTRIEVRDWKLAKGLP